MTTATYLTREALKAQARRTGCNGTGCDLTRFFKAGDQISASCSICGRIFGASIEAPKPASNDWLPFPYGPGPRRPMTDEEKSRAPRATIGRAAAR